MIYDINGTVLYNSLESNFSDNMELDYEFDSATDANYTVLRIYKNKKDGNKQYPFVYAPNGTGVGTQSTLDMNKQKGFPVAINAGVFSSSIKPSGVTIQNSVLIQQGSNTTSYILTIDDNGDLSYQEPNADGATLIANGIVSAVCGFCPIIVNYEPVNANFYSWISHYNQNTQRQIIGQFGNGDYAIVTCEGRDYDHSDGWTITEAITICQNIGLKFAYNLDGGGSTETVLGKKQINTIYENETGRIVPTFIVFNGTNMFGVPN